MNRCYGQVLFFLRTKIIFSSATIVIPFSFCIKCDPFSFYIKNNHHVFFLHSKRIQIHNVVYSQQIKTFDVNSNLKNIFRDFFKKVISEIKANLNVRMIGGFCFKKIL